MISATCAVTLCLTPALQISTSGVNEQVSSIPAFEVMHSNHTHNLLQPASITISNIEPYNITQKEQEVLHMALMRSVQIIDEGNFIE